MQFYNKIINMPLVKNGTIGGITYATPEEGTSIKIKSLRGSAKENEALRNRIEFEGQVVEENPFGGKKITNRWRRVVYVGAEPREAAEKALSSFEQGQIRTIVSDIFRQGFPNFYHIDLTAALLLAERFGISVPFDWVNDFFSSDPSMKKVVTLAVAVPANPSQGMAAIKATQTVTDPRVVEFLGAILRDESLYWEARVEAANSLAKLDDKESLAMLLQSLRPTYFQPGGTDISVRFVIRRALENRVSQAIPFLWDILKDNVKRELHPTVLEILSKAEDLSSIQDSRAPELLMSYVQRDSIYFPSGEPAIKILGNLGNLGTFEGLVKRGLIDRLRSFKGTEAVRTLVKLKEIDALIQVLPELKASIMKKDQPSWERIDLEILWKTIILELVKTSDPRYVDLLIEELKWSRESLKQSNFDILSYLVKVKDPRAMEFMSMLFQDFQGSVVPSALYHQALLLIEQLKEKRNPQELNEFLNVLKLPSLKDLASIDPSYFTNPFSLSPGTGTGFRESSIAAVILLGKMGDDASVETLKSHLWIESNPDVRLAILNALQEASKASRDEQLVSIFWKVSVLDPDPDVRKRALELFQENKR